MTYIKKDISNGSEVGITSGEVVIPVASVSDLSDKQIARVVRELVDDYEYLKCCLGSGELDGMSIPEAREYVKRKEQNKKSQIVKQEFTQRRRRQFDSIRDQLMLALIDRDGYICQHPDCEVQEDLTIDHIVPLSRGGSDELDNLQLLCRQHNGRKRDSC